MTGSLTYYRSPPWRELFLGKSRAHRSPAPTLLSREKAPLGAMVSTNGGGSPCDPNRSCSSIMGVAYEAKFYSWDERKRKKMRKKKGVVVCCLVLQGSLV